MARLYCEEHGREREEEIIQGQEEYRQADENMLVVSGTLYTGPWLCDRCNAQLMKGDQATLVSCYPRHCRDDLYRYDFGYERHYFAMRDRETATAYGADWPDDSIRRRQGDQPSSQPTKTRVLCSLDFSKPKTG